MYSKSALGWLLAAAASLSLSGIAVADTGKSPNGPPGPEGNPNQPQSAPQAPPAKQESAPNGQANGHSKAPPPRRAARKPAGKPKPKSRRNSRSKGKSQSRPKNKQHGERNSNAAPKGKVWICHATGSETNPYTLINVSVNAWYEKDGTTRKSSGHGGHEDDIFFGPNQPAGEDRGGHACAQQTQGAAQKQSTTTSPTTTTTTAPAPVPERATDAGESGVLGAHASGGSDDEPGGGGVLGASASGGDDDAAPAAARETRSRNVGSLPFTGLELAFLVIAGMAALLGGVALRRALAGRA